MWMVSWQRLLSGFIPLEQQRRSVQPCVSPQWNTDRTSRRLLPGDPELSEPLTVSQQLSALKL